MDGYVPDETVRRTRKVLTDPVLRSKMAKHNYETAQKYYFYSDFIAAAPPRAAFFYVFL